MTILDTNELQKKLERDGKDQVRMKLHQGLYAEWKRPFIVWWLQYGVMPVTKVETPDVVTVETEKVVVVGGGLEPDEVKELAADLERQLDKTEDPEVARQLADADALKSENTGFGPEAGESIDTELAEVIESRQLAQPDEDLAQLVADKPHIIEEDLASMSTGFGLAKRDADGNKIDPDGVELASVEHSKEIVLDTGEIEDDSMQTGFGLKAVIHEDVERKDTSDSDVNPLPVKDIHTVFVEGDGTDGARDDALKAAMGDMGEGEAKELHKGVREFYGEGYEELGSDEKEDPDTEIVAKENLATQDDFRYNPHCIVDGEKILEAEKKADAEFKSGLVVQGDKLVKLGEDPDTSDETPN